MNDDEAFFRLEDESPSSYQIWISSILAVIVTAVLVWVVFETIRRVQIGDYSYYLILLVFMSGATLIAYSIIIRERQEEGS
ncbi:MAG: hypothetical protein ACXADC_00415 [Candidatus Thorarchaeota archaeon]